MSLARCTFQLEVHEAELYEESEDKARKVAAQRRVAPSRLVLGVKKDMWWRMGTCELACSSLREACSRFCPWFAKIICSPVSGACLAELSKPCANLARPCSTAEFSWGPATTRKGKSMPTALKCRVDLFFLTIPFWKVPNALRRYANGVSSKTSIKQTETFFAW